MFGCAMHYVLLVSIRDVDVGLRSSVLSSFLSVAFKALQSACSIA